MTSTKQHNANFIAHAREDIPYLLSEVDRLTVELEQKTRDLERYWALERDGRILPASPDGEYDGEKIKSVARASNGNIIIETWAKDHISGTFMRHILTDAEAEAALSAEGVSK